MTRRPIETNRAAEMIRRHGAVAVLVAIAIAALAGLATLFLADRRADEARATAAIVATAADTTRVILGEEQRLLAQLAADAASDLPDAVTPAPAPGIRAAARFDPTGAPAGRWSGELADPTLAALGAEAVRAATAEPAAALFLTRAISDPRTGSMVVGLARPYFAADGAPGGVVLVAIDPSAFAAIDRLPIVPAGGSIELLRGGGAPLFADDARPDTASRRAEIAGFPLAVSYRPAASDARHGLRARAAYLALAAIALIAALGLAGLMLHRQRQDKREIARLAALERQLRNELTTVAATADRSDAQSRTKSQFFAQVTHELRTPLNAILGFTQTIRQEMFGPVNNPRYLEYARLISDAGSHLLSLINDLLDNARIEAGKMEVAPIRVSAPALARSALDLVELLAEGRDIAIAATGLAACPDLNVDPRAMKQVLVNLLSNAIKYTTIGGRIELRFAARSDGGVTIEIADTGIGMSAEDAAQAFEPFGRAASDKARRQQGTGLGLSLARALVRLHGGDLTLASRLGAGTTATVTLPASAAFAGSGPRLLPAAKPDAAAA